jgi:ribonuclease HI
MLVTVIADASFDFGTRAGGYGYWAKSERKRHSGGGPLKSLARNNNLAEMMAILHGVHMAFVHGVALPGDTILAQTDCTAAIMAFEGTRVLQEDEQILVDGMKTLLGIRNALIRYRHVKGHTAGDTPRTWVNNHCDEMAKKGMREARVGLPVIDVVVVRKSVAKRRAAAAAAKKVEPVKPRVTGAEGFDHQAWHAYVSNATVLPWEERPR